jgi:hypothetical protein
VDQTQGPELKREVEERLEDLFGEPKTTAGGPGEPGGPGASPLRELKAAVLSIDWEISDEILDKLADEVAALKDTFRNDKVLLLFLQLLASVARYLKDNKEKSHPDAVKLLNSIYINLDKVHLARGWTQEQRKRVLFREIQKFKTLKARIAAQNARSGPAPVTASGSGEAEGRSPRPRMGEPDREKPSLAAGMDGMTPQEALALAVEEIRKAIRIEFEALRLELRSM